MSLLNYFCRRKGKVQCTDLTLNHSNSTSRNTLKLTSSNLQIVIDLNTYKSDRHPLSTTHKSHLLYLDKEKPLY